MSKRTLAAIFFGISAIAALSPLVIHSLVVLIGGIDRTSLGVRGIEVCLSDHCKLHSLRLLFDSGLGGAATSISMLATMVQFILAASAATLAFIFFKSLEKPVLVKRLRLTTTLIASAGFTILPIIITFMVLYFGGQKMSPSPGLAFYTTMAGYIAALAGTTLVSIPKP